MRKKLIYVISDIDKALAFEWTTNHFHRSFDLSFILICEKKTALADFLTERNICWWHIDNNKYCGWTGQLLKLFQILKKERPAIVHIHMWRAMLLALPVAWILGIRKRIFTRHHAIVHYNEHPSGKKWDRLCNAMATDIVAVSENIKTILVEKDRANPRKIHMIHHGFDLEYFQSLNTQRVQAVRQRHGIPLGKPIVGVISRYLEWKGLTYIIEAFSILRNTYPGSHLVLANAKGNYQSCIKKQLCLLPSESFTEILFEQDLAALYGIFDVYVHTPVDEQSEAFGQTYVEALACGIPSVFSKSGVASEFIRHELNALVVPYRDSSAIAAAIERILANPTLAASLIREGKASIQPFALQNMLSKLEALYG